MQYRRKPEAVEAITFGDLVLHGAHECEKAGHALGPNAMPWSFTYAGHHISHENDDCYLVNTGTSTVQMNRGDMLVTDDQGGIYAIKLEAFFSMYESGD